MTQRVRIPTNVTIGENHGKPFRSPGLFPFDHWKNREELTLADVSEICRSSRFGELNWSEVRDLILASYRLAALKRRLGALDGKSSKAISGRAFVGLQRFTTDNNAPAA